jgi:Fe2+ transport system protein FeoA
MRLLGELRRGETGVVTDVAVEPADERRLKSLGICLGRTLQVVSPGSPLIVRVLGTRVGLSAALARRVTVQAC